jgi:hypothetical protein
MYVMLQTGTWQCCAKEIAKVESEGHPLVKKIVAKTTCQPKATTPGLIER